MVARRGASGWCTGGGAARRTRARPLGAVGIDRSDRPLVGRAGGRAAIGIGRAGDRRRGGVMGWRQMSMRGLAKARGEWSLVTMAWNIKRLHVLRTA